MLFDDYGRYLTLVSDIARSTSMKTRYPQLVSFVGVTNAGKSTLIKMLVHRGHGYKNDSGIKSDKSDKNDKSEKSEKTLGSSIGFPSPVVGSAVNDSLATSGDVHLYADPATHTDPLPTLYADCEGFEGGERSPLGSQSQLGSQESQSAATRAWVNTRRIRWADTEEHRRREYAVTVLYPRLLYSFSDCVAFVLRNPKTFGSAALTKLLDWGAAALEKSINQPTLPHCIVVLNGSHPGIESAQWDSSHATKSLLSSVSNAFDRIEGVARFRQLADHWRGLGREINSVNDLILCYYASFKVVRIPAAPQYMLISQQVDKLHAAIHANCRASHEAKRRARLLLDTDELNLYIQSGFDHFTTHIEVPFNFMQVSLRRNPIPRNFGGHILQLCESLSARMPSRDAARVESVFGKLNVVLASCVLLDCARFRKGQLHELIKSYAHHFEFALTEYFQLHYPCSFVSTDGRRGCVLVKARHQTKGHQDESGIIAAGHYESALETGFAQKCLKQLETAINDLHRMFSKELDLAAMTSKRTVYAEEPIAFAIHVDRLDSFYRFVGPATWIRSHSTCFCCLMDVPQHSLPCGHALCDRCARACGDLTQSTLLISWCPLHQHATRWTQPKVVKYKPRGAGVRVLVLDGGGIRGIVQLEILRAIEQALDGHLPVQALFDLMVGSGTGGLIAVALAKEKTSLDQCQEAFGTICRQSYSVKTPGVALIHRVSRALRSRPQYGRSGIREALESEFGEKKDFFGEMEQFRPDVRVAVTSINLTNNRTTLLSNYRRPQPDDACKIQHHTDSASDYEYDRPNDPAGEMKTWQAVYATMADPRYFGTLPSISGRQFIGVRADRVKLAAAARAEARKIWPDIAEPDLILSLGTGQNRAAVLAELLKGPKTVDAPSNTQWLRNGISDAPSMAKWWLRSDNDVLEAERTWQEFASQPASETSKAPRGRRVRFNVDLGKEAPPAQDRDSQIQRISALVGENLQESHRCTAVRSLAHHLVALLFYYNEQATTTDAAGSRHTIGRISCRYEDHSAYAKRLGKVLESRCCPDFEPFFSIPSTTTEPRHKICITSEIRSQMMERGVFRLPDLVLPLQDEKVAPLIHLHLLRHDRLEPRGYPISQAPRQTVANDNVVEGQVSFQNHPSTEAMPEPEQYSAKHGRHFQWTGASRGNLIHEEATLVDKSPAFPVPSEKTRPPRPTIEEQLPPDAVPYGNDQPPPHDARV